MDETIKPGINNLHLPKGATVTYKLTNDSNKLNYIYPELFLNNEELNEWLRKKNNGS